MSEAENGVVPPVVTDPPVAPAPAVTPPATPPAAVGITSEQLKARLDEATESGKKKLLKELGFEKPEDVKAILKLARDQQESELTEKQRLEKEIEALKPRAVLADSLATQMASMVEEQFTSLPEATRNVIDDIAKGDASRRFELMQAMRKHGFGAATTAAPTVPPKKDPVTTSPPPVPPPSKGAPTKWDEYQALEKKNSMLGAMFYESNRVAIEQSKPAQ